tara:strand:- start:191 stop:457 length:267 start_codon:yes stop_codon:yes gene_type:complete
MYSIINQMLFRLKKIRKKMEIAVLEGDLKLINKIKKNFGEYEIKTDDADIGNGADLWITIVGIVGVVFLQGGKINKNLDAWLEIGKKK